MKNAIANTEACLTNIERYNGITNAFITVMADQALEQAPSMRRPLVVNGVGCWPDYRYR